MNLREIFILNLKKFRKIRRLSQMNLAEKCDTAASYIGEIEIGRKFPSIEMIEKIAGALNIEAYRLFINETNGGVNETLEYLAALPIRVRLDLAERLKDIVHNGIGQVLAPDYPKTPSPETGLSEMN
ncbi:MAG: helix-turn-helix domain-containing protein [Treponema sp.]|jgi:transcriptional regulator with XRE-family HTH domain|nr:helix-turn-helix domain-containing protein [Treponema sp.]